MDILKRIIARLEVAAEYKESFVFFVYHSPLTKKQDWSDMSDVEDLFDYSYLEDAEVEAICIHFAETKKKKGATKAEAQKEAQSRAEFCVSNSSADKATKAALKVLAKEWAAKVAPTIVNHIDDYL